MPINPAEDERVEEVNTRYETLAEESKEAVRRLMQRNGVRHVQIRDSRDIDEITASAQYGRSTAAAVEIMYDAGMEVFVQPADSEMRIDGYLNDGN